MHRASPPENSPDIQYSIFSIRYSVFNTPESCLLKPAKEREEGGEDVCDWCQAFESALINRFDSEPQTEIALVMMVPEREIGLEVLIVP